MLMMVMHNDDDDGDDDEDLDVWMCGCIDYGLWKMEHDGCMMMAADDGGA